MSSLAEIQARIEERKRKLGDQAAASATAKRWRTKGEINAEADRAYRARQAEAEALRARKRADADTASQRDSKAVTDGDLRSDGSDSAKVADSSGGSAAELQTECPPTATAREQPPLRRDEVVRRLRAFGEPATLFGEEDIDRFRRLRVLELAKSDESRGQMNIFQTKLREMERKETVREAYEYSGAILPHASSDSKQEAGYLRKAGDAPTDSAAAASSCPEDYVYGQVRRWLAVWEEDISSMPAEQRRTNQGRSAAATLEQTKEWLKPLVRQLRKRRLAPNILRALVNIFEAVHEREYVRANAYYYEELAIGNAPWPMGATMVGIHARAAREKISEDKIAHVMNDEKSRKYIQGIKRLVTLAQRHFPTVPSKMIKS